jgi:hypothetical protein
VNEVCGGGIKCCGDLACSPGNFLTCCVCAASVWFAVVPSPTPLSLLAGGALAKFLLLFADPPHVDSLPLGKTTHTPFFPTPPRRCSLPTPQSGLPRRTSLKRFASSPTPRCWTTASASSWIRSAFTTINAALATAVTMTVTPSTLANPLPPPPPSSQRPPPSMPRVPPDIPAKGASIWKRSVASQPGIACGKTQCVGWVLALQLRHPEPPPLRLRDREEHRPF